MRLRLGGTDIFYIDESGSHGLFVFAAARIPFIRFQDGHPTLVWNDYLDAATNWRRSLSATRSIRFREELHGVHLIGRRNRYHKARRNLFPDEAFDTYAEALQTLGGIVPDNMTITTCATTESRLFGNRGSDAALIGLFQRLR